MNASKSADIPWGRALMCCAALWVIHGPAAFADNGSSWTAELAPNFRASATIKPPDVGKKLTGTRLCGVPLGATIGEVIARWGLPSGAHVAKGPTIQVLIYGDLARFTFEEHRLALCHLGSKDGVAPHAFVHEALGIRSGQSYREAFQALQRGGLVSGSADDTAHHIRVKTPNPYGLTNVFMSRKTKTVRLLRVTVEGLPKGPRKAGSGTPSAWEGRILAAVSVKLRRKAPSLKPSAWRFKGERRLGGAPVVNDALDLDAIIRLWGRPTSFAWYEDTLQHLSFHYRDGGFAHFATRARPHTIVILRGNRKTSVGRVLPFGLRFGDRYDRVRKKVGPQASELNTAAFLIRRTFPNDGVGWSVAFGGDDMGKKTRQRLGTFVVAPMR